MIEGPPAALGALSEPIRVEIVDRISAGTQVTVTQLAAVLPITRQGVARHVKTLEDAGIIEGHQVGREHRYRVERTAVDDAHRWLGRRAASWDAALARLSAHVESSPPGSD